MILNPQQNESFINSKNSLLLSESETFFNKTSLEDKNGGKI